MDWIRTNKAQQVQHCECPCPEVVELNGIRSNSSRCNLGLWEDTLPVSWQQIDHLIGVDVLVFRNSKENAVVVFDVEGITHDDNDNNSFRIWEMPSSRDA